MRRLLDPLFLTATVISLGPDVGRMRAVTLGGDDLEGLEVTPGQHVRLQVTAENRLLDRIVGALRTYSVWAYDGRHLQLRIFLHGDGPGTRWAEGVRVGDPVQLLKPQGTFVTRPGDHHLFAGDETASVAFGAMIRGLNERDPGVPTYAVVEIDTPDEQLDIPGQVTWLHRYGRSAASSTRLVAALAKLDLPMTSGTAYLAGESRTIQLLRNHLVRERGWQRNDIVIKPFWMPGKTGME